MNQKKMNNIFLTLFNLSSEISQLNDKLNNFAATYLDSPWAGTLMLGILFAFGCWGISALTKK